MSTPQSSAARKLGERIRAERQRLGVNQEELAHLVGMHFTNVGKIERGQSNPTLETIVRIAGVLGVDAGSLVTGIGVGDLPEKVPRYTAADFVREREKRNRGLKN